MGVKKLTWNSLLRYAELKFEPEAPKVLEVSDELVQSLSWLTAATKHDRRLVRCTEQGSLLVADEYAGLNSVDYAELYPEPNNFDDRVITVANKGVLVATSTQIIKAIFYPKAAVGAEHVFIPTNWLYWHAKHCEYIMVETVPVDTGAASYVGITVFN